MTRRKLMQRLGGLFAGLVALAAGLLSGKAEAGTCQAKILRSYSVPGRWMRVIYMPPCHDEGRAGAMNYARTRPDMFVNYQGPTICGRFAQLRGRRS